jgi:hypothetical protein
VSLAAQPIRPLLDFLFGILVVIMFALFFKELRNRDELSSIIPYSEFWLLANICSFYLALVSTTSLGINIVLGRKEAGWIKYRQTLPVPPLVYLLGEIIPYWLIWSILAFLLAITSSIFLDLSLSSTLDISQSLVVGMLPFLFLGLAIGYGLPLGSVDLIALGLLQKGRISGNYSKNKGRYILLCSFLIFNFLTSCQDKSTPVIRILEGNVL